MRMLARTFAILAVAAAVAGSVFAVVQSSYAQTLFPAGPARGAFAGERSSTTGAQTTGWSLPLNNGVASGRP